MLTKRRFLLPLLGWICISFAASWGIEAARAADHGDTPLLIGAGRHDGRLTGLFAFLRDDHLVLIATLDPTIPAEAEEYQFASDLRVEILIDNRDLRQRMGAAARRLAETELSWKSVVDRVEKAYKYARSKIGDGCVNSVCYS